MGELIYRPNVLSNIDQQRIEVGAVKNVQELMDEFNFAPHMEPLMECFIQGRHIPREEWLDVRPLDGDHILVAAIPQGDGGKDILRLVAVIALAAVVPQLGLGMIGQVGVMIAGTLAINAIFPPASINPSGEHAAVSPTYSIQGQRNQTIPYGPARRVYGQHRIYPPNAAQPYGLTTGNDRWLRMLLHVGYGNYDIDDIRIGETPLSSFPNSVVLKKTSDANGVMPNMDRYSRDVNTTPLSIDMKQGVNNDRTTVPNVDAVEVDITFPRGLTAFNDKGKKVWKYFQYSVQWKPTSSGVWNNLGAAESFTFSRNSMRVVDLGSDTHGYIPHSPFNIQDEDTGTTIAEGSLIQFEGAEFTPIGDSDPAGTAITQPLYGYPRGTQSLLVTTYKAITAGAWIQINGATYTITNSVGVGSVTINLNRPLDEDLITRQYEYTGPDTPYVQATAYTGGGAAFASTPQNIEIKGGQLEPFTAVVTLNFATRDTYDIRVIRRTADPDESKATDGVHQSVWTGLRTFTNEAPVNFQEQHTFLECQFKATERLSGTIDNVNCLATSRLLVYTTPTTSSVVPTRNPAWIIMDILTGTATPLPVPLNRLNIQSFIDFAAWCDQTTDDNLNSNEPKYRFDGVVDYNTTAWELAKSVAASARGSIIQQDGKFTMIWDKLQTVPVQMITPHNSWGFSANRSFAEIPHAVKATFIDPSSQWQRGEQIVYDTGYSVANATIIEELPLLGVTRATQAWRDARYFLTQAKLRQETATLTMDIENVVCTRGDYVQLQQDVARIGGEPGRITDISGNNVTLTEPFNIQAGTYQLRVREVRGNANDMVTYTIQSQVDSHTVTLTTPCTGAVGDLAVWGLEDFVTDDWLVKEIAPGPDFTATLTLVRLTPELYDSDKGEIPDYNPPVAPDLGVPPPPVEGLDARQEPFVVDETPEGWTPLFYYRNREPHFNLILQWRRSDAAVTSYYEVYWLKADDWELQGTTTDTTFTVFEDASTLDADSPGAQGVDHSFKVLAVSATGNKMNLDSVPALVYTIRGDETGPAAPVNASAESLGDSVTLSWEPPADPDIAYYGVRFFSLITDGTAVYEESNLVIPTIPYDTTKVSLPARLGTYFINAQDTSGNLGANIPVVTTANPIAENLTIQVITEAPFGGPYWTGIKTNMEVDVNNNLILTDVTQDGFYEFANSVTLAGLERVRLTSFLEAAGELNAAPSPYWAVLTEVQVNDGGIFMADWPDLTSVAALSDGEAGAISDWLPFTQMDASGAAFNFRFRVVSTDRATQVKLAPNASAFGPYHVVASAVARAEGDTQVFPDAIDTRVDFANAFHQAPSVTFSFTQGDMQSTYSITAVDTHGFNVKPTLLAGNTGDASWTAVGYGVVE
jgi:hypothetical protein